MKKSDAYENHAAREAKQTLIVAIIFGLLVAVGLGFILGTPSKADREKAEATQRQYQDLRAAVDKAAAMPKEDWSCLQGPVTVEMQTSQVPSPSGWRLTADGGRLSYSDDLTMQTFKTVSERTTMNCHRKVKEYIEKE